MTLPSLPSLGSTTWYSWATAIHAAAASASQVNVRTYGATGNGATDDTAAIQAAADAAGATDGGTVVLPAGSYRITDTIIVPDKVRLVGVSRSGTTIVADSAFSLTKPMVKLGNDAGGLDDDDIVFMSRVELMTLDAADRAPICIHSPLGQEMSGARDVVCTRFRTTGVKIDGASRLMSFERMEIYGSALGWSYGFHIDSIAGPVTVRGVTINSNTNDPTKYGIAGIYAKSTHVNLWHIHGERCADTVVFDANAVGVATAIDATTGVSGKAVRITAAATGLITLLSVSGVNDQVTGRSLGHQAIYAVDGTGGFGGLAVFTLDATATTQVKNATTYIGRTIRYPRGQTATGAVTVDLTLADYHALDMAGNVTLTVSGATDGQHVTLEVRQGGTGSYTISWPAGVMRWTGNTAPTLSTAAGSFDMFTFVARGGKLRELSRSLGQIA